MSIDLTKLVFNEEGLIPAIIQDAQSKAVLMLAYMNREALQKTMETGETWFWSRSRQELWHKGATSGNRQVVKEMYYDCDQDTLLFLVEPIGPACHRNTYTCFDRVEFSSATKTTDATASAEQRENLGREAYVDYAIISQLIETIAKRDEERPEGAYTTYLFEKGLDKILKKVGEEASEVIIAAKNRDPEELRNESADLLYHLFVLWREQGLGLEQVLDILRERHGK